MYSDPCNYVPTNVRYNGKIQIWHCRLHVYTIYAVYPALNAYDPQQIRQSKFIQ